MLSKAKSKFIVSLQRKKIRDGEGLFIIEGDKIVKEFLAAGKKLKMLIAKPEFLKALPGNLLNGVDEVEEASYDELRSLSTLKTPHNALAVVPVPTMKPGIDQILEDLCVALEFVQDPGNLGTIIRAAGWFGIKNIVCSPDCVDVYNPKVIQASMGALLHVEVSYQDLPVFLSAAAGLGKPVFGTVLEGDSVYDHPLKSTGIILLGNESKGISPDLMPYINHKILIPRFGEAKPGIDSLNVGMAASVIFSEFRRRYPV
jgi:TrmH family RNA methyltransferase